MAYFFSLGLRPPRADGLAAGALAAGGLVAGGAVVAGAVDGAAERAGRVAGTRRARPASSLTPMVRWLVRCLMKNARPIARGCTRFIEGPPSAIACTTRRSSRFRTWWLCSAF